jgi:hypothetical protein
MCAAQGTRAPQHDGPRLSSASHPSRCQEFGGRHVSHQEFEHQIRRTLAEYDVQDMPAFAESSSPLAAIQDAPDVVRRALSGLGALTVEGVFVLFRQISWTTSGQSLLAHLWFPCQAANVLPAPSRKRFQGLSMENNTRSCT